MRCRRVAFFAPQLSQGGSERQLELLALGLKQRGWDVFVWCQAHAGIVADELRRQGIVVEQARQGFTPTAIRVLELSLFLRRHRPGVLHSFGYGAHWIDALAAAVCRVPLYVTSRRNMRHWDPEQYLKLSERLRNRLSDRVVGNCRAVIERACSVEGLDRNRILTIYNGVHDVAPMSKLAAKQALGFSADTLLIGNVGNLKSVKGQDILIRAFAAVLLQVPNARLIIVGRDELDGALGRLVVSLGLDPVIQLLPSRPAQEVLPALDVYVHPSRAEGFPNAILEAMATGVPVVATAVGGVPEMIDDGASGLLVEPEETHPLASALVRLCHDERARASMGQAARRRARECFRVDAMIDGHERLYAEACKRSEC